jgi:hypothetical protein
MSYPSLILENQFGEVSNNFVKGGSSRLRCKFTVDNTNSKGITGLSAEGIRAVYMHTVTTPFASNPNPAAGYIQVEFDKAFSSFQSLATTVIPPQSGSSLLVASAGLTAGLVYVITTVGTTTQAAWEGLGVPAGVTAAPGVAFVALATSALGTGAVQVPVTGGTAILSVTPVGDPSVGQDADGEYAVVLLACYKAGGTFTGSALAAHSHDFVLKNAAVADGATTRVNAGTNLIGANTGSDLTVAGGGANGGVQTVSAGTPAGTIAGANVLGAPVNGSVIELDFVVVPVAAPLI